MFSSACRSPWSSWGHSATDTPERRHVVLFVALVVGVAAVASGHLGLLLWSGGLTTITAGAMAWSRVAWTGFDVSVSFRPARVFTGEPLELRVRVRNDKRLPVPIARIAVWLPPGLQSAEERRSAIRGFRRRFFLAPRSEAVFDFGVRTTTRGEYWLERIGVELSDPFELAPVGGELKPAAAVIVLPRRRVAVPVRVRRRLPFGSPAAAPRVFEERDRFGGVRPYEAGDPLNRIHWRLTGHTGSLQTKIFEPTRSAELLLALDIAAGEPFWDSVYPKIAERTIEWASFLGREAVEAGWRVGLVANTHFRRAGGRIRIPPTAAYGREAVLFAALARMPNEPTADLAPVLRDAARVVEPSTTALVISPRPGPGLLHEMAVLRRRGVEVLHVSPIERMPGARVP